MYYDTITATYHASQTTLTATGLRVADLVTLKTCGILPCKTNAIPAGMVASGGYSIEVIGDVAHKILNVCPPEVKAQADATLKEALDDLSAAEEANKAMFKMFAKEINKLRVLAGGQAYSGDEWRDKLKVEM